MDKTILQHFEQAVNEDFPQLHSQWSSAVQFNLHFVVAIFAESRKCRMVEGHEGLLRNACRALVFSHQSAFEAYFRRMGRTFYWEAKDYEKLAVELEALAPKVKGLIERWLCGYRQSLFDEHADYLMPFGEVHFDVKAEDHPMRTFHHWLDYLDRMVRIDNFDTWFYLKRSVVDLARVGNAFIPRFEWEPIVTVLPSFIKKAQS